MSKFQTVDGMAPGDIIPLHSGEGVQLSLFDFTPIYRLICLPMGDLHGTAFARLFGSERPAVVVDVRNYPYFDLISLSRSIAFAIFETSHARYLHLPLDLRPPSSQSDRWKLKKNANEVLGSILDETLYSRVHTYALLVDELADIEVLGQVIRNSESDREFRWQIELPELSGAR